MSQVRIYWNLNRDCISVQDARTRRVIGYARNVLLADVAYTVSETGRQRAVRDNQRNVHAYAVGELVAADWIGAAPLPIQWTTAHAATARAMAQDSNRVRYNPFRSASFTNGTGEPIAASATMYLTGDKSTKAQCYKGN